MARTEMRMEMYDAMCPQERELVQEFGLACANQICRQYYGRWDEARKLLEAERQALQITRQESINLAGLWRRGSPG